MADNIKYGELPAKMAGGGRGLKWADTLQEVVENCPEGQSARVAERETSSAASSLAQTMRNTAEKVGINVTVATRSEDEGVVGVWVTPSGKATKKSSSKKSTKKSTAKKGGSKKKRVVKKS